MSTIIMSQCWPLQGLSVTQKAVLISLADQANDDGVCWPAVGTIAARCCMSARAVRSAMDHLEAVGLLARDRRFNSSTVYSVTPAKFNAAAAPSKGTRKTGKNGTAPGAGAAPHAGGAPGAGGEGRSPLPIEPATLDSEPGVYPVRFTTTPGPLPGPLRAAVLLLLGDLYANREAVVAGTQLAENPTLDRLMFPYRRVLP